MVGALVAVGGLAAAAVDGSTESVQRRPRSSVRRSQRSRSSASPETAERAASRRVELQAASDRCSDTDRGNVRVPVVRAPTGPARRARRDTRSTWRRSPSSASSGSCCSSARLVALAVGAIRARRQRFVGGGSRRARRVVPQRLHSTGTGRWSVSRLPRSWRWRRASSPPSGWSRARPRTARACGRSSPQACVERLADLEPRRQSGALRRVAMRSRATDWSSAREHGRRRAGPARSGRAEPELVLGDAAAGSRRPCRQHSRSYRDAVAHDRSTSWVAWLRARAGRARLGTGRGVPTRCV
mgnify:CR=1 FL=1